MRGKIKKPYWCRKAKSEMVLRGISNADLAKALGVTTSYVSSVLNGNIIAFSMVNAISDYLDISNDYYAGESQKTESEVGA